jgi:hypothetical protein
MEIRELQAQYVTDHNGKKTAVILPIEEFEELLEDLDDLAVLAERRDEPAIPFKVLLKEAIVELFEERQEVFAAIVAEAIEDIGLANAIREGRKNDFVSKEEIDAILAD